MAKIQCPRCNYSTDKSERMEEHKKKYGHDAHRKIKIFKGFQQGQAKKKG